jgi:hypothetical protein
MSNFNVGTRVDLDYTSSKGEIIRVVGTIVEPSKNINTATHFAVQLDVPRVRKDSPRPQAFITIAKTAVLVPA